MAKIEVDIPDDWIVNQLQADAKTIIACIKQDIESSARLGKVTQNRLIDFGASMTYLDAINKLLKYYGTDPVELEDEFRQHV